MPSAFYRALGKLLPCATLHSAKNETGRPNGRTERMGRDGSGTSPSAGLVALGKDPKFAECQICSTRRTLKLRQVPDAWHSAKFGSLPSATRLALGEVSNFAECLGNYTRQICFPGNRKMVALPSVRLKTLAKLAVFLYFFCFLCNNHIHHHKESIYTFQTSDTVYIWHIHHVITQISHAASHEYHK